MASYADLEDLFQEEKAATAYNEPGLSPTSSPSRASVSRYRQAEEKPYLGSEAEDQQEPESTYQGSETGNEGETQTAPAGVPQQGQDRGTTAPQSGLMRITHGDQSYLADPMAPQQGQPLQQQAQGAPISPEMRAAWPYLNNQQRAAMLQHREQTQNQAWLNQQKLTQAERMRKAKLEQQKSAIMNGPYSDSEKVEYTKLLDIPLEVLNKKEAQEKIAIKQQERKELEDELAFRKAVELNGGNLDAKTMPHRTYNVEDAQGNQHTYMITPKGHIPVGEGKGSHAAEGTGTGKGHDPLASSVTANTSTKEGTKSINWEGVDKDRAELKKRQQQEEEDKLPGVRDDKGARGGIREAAKTANVSLSGPKKKQVMDALKELDRLAQVPPKAWAPDQKDAQGNVVVPGDSARNEAANKIAGPYLPTAKATATVGGQKIGGVPDRNPETVLGGEQQVAAGGGPAETPVQRAARQQEEKADYKAFIEEYARRKGMTVRDAERYRQRNSPASLATVKANQDAAKAEALRQVTAEAERDRMAAERRAKAKAAYDAELEGTK